ncbi:hypothetical protein H9Y04_06545 [Streptomyces sp. TRM66268-LWL]|uniref:Uncharacterized protein n=1 Tax=Streptomyces polyasparticus TaxID=2767826 RepID=A0ABR7S9T1_9ACTN|nr:hypothetical protein [Streptomyces polyasparticus]MBC9712230.1 hypothetical protein [Streptomyces polyasparticus]
MMITQGRGWFGGDGFAASVANSRKIDAAAAEAEKVLYQPEGIHGMPKHHKRMRPDGEGTINFSSGVCKESWLERIENHTFPGAQLPLKYAPESVQTVRASLVELNSTLGEIEDTCEALLEDYATAGQAAQAKMVEAAKNGSLLKPGNKGPASAEKARKDAATKYHTAVEQRNVLYKALSDVYRTVVAETSKGLEEWHDNIVSAMATKLADAGPQITEAVRTLIPLLSESQTLMGYSVNVREAIAEGIGEDAVAPESKAEDTMTAIGGAIDALHTLTAGWAQIESDKNATATVVDWKLAHTPRKRYVLDEQEAKELYNATLNTFMPHSEAYANANVMEFASDAEFLSAIGIGGDPRGNAMDGMYLDHSTGQSEWVEGP